MTAKRKVAGSNLVTDDFSTLLACSCGLCGYLGRNPGEGVKLGSNPRKADENHSLSHRIKSNQPTLAAERTRILLKSIFIIFSKGKFQEVTRDECGLMWAALAFMRSTL
jgi:hypothetical protein